MRAIWFICLGALGCDSPVLHENLETALCGVLPWSAADCSDPDVLEKAAFSGAVVDYCTGFNLGAL